VAALLETLRALKESAPLKNDVILLFTDGEETGLLGAQAFVREHPWAKDAGVVLNFEARGNSGPSLMFETSGQNGWLIGELAKAAPYPIANSLSYEIYKLLPNDTDFTIFRGAGLSGMNFAFIEGLTHYHSQIDSASNVDERSLQHHGTYALALARHFGSRDGLENKERNAVYFNVPGFLIHYSSAWIIPLIVVVAAVFVVVTVYGLRKRQLSVTGIVWGFLACLLNIIVVPVVAFGLWFLINRTSNAYGRMPFGDTYNSGFYLAGFTALTIAIVASLYRLARRKISSENLMLGGFLWWLILLVLSGLFLPGGTYLFTWPLLFSLSGLAAIIAFKNGQQLPLKLAIVLSVCALPGVVLLVPLVAQIFTALTVKMVWVTMIFVVLLLWLLIPLLDFLTSRHRWLLSGVALAVTLVLIGIGGLTSGFDKQHPEPYHLIYGLDADADTAVWATAEGQPDRWAIQFFSKGAKRTALGEFYYKYPGTFLVASAPMTSLPTPVVTLVKDEKKAGSARQLQLHVEAAAGETSVFVHVSSEVKTTQASINGKEIVKNGTTEPFQFGTDWGARYYAPPATGIDLVLELESDSPVKVQVIGLSHGLPEIGKIDAKYKPEQLMPAPYLNNNSTMVIKTFSFN
jgi:MFS family permease